MPFPAITAVYGLCINGSTTKLYKKNPGISNLSTLYRLIYTVQSLSRHCLLRGGEGQDKSAKNCQYLFRGKSVISNCTHHHISD